MAVCAHSLIHLAILLQLFNRMSAYYKLQVESTTLRCIGSVFVLRVTATKVGEQ